MAPAIDEARAVEETVRRFFVGGDGVDGVALTAGPLRDVAALLGELRLPSRRTGIRVPPARDDGAPERAETP